MNTITLAPMGKPTDYLMPHSHMIIAQYSYPHLKEVVQHTWQPDAWYSNTPDLRKYLSAYFIVRPKIPS